MRLVLMVALLGLIGIVPANAVESIPACRLDNSSKVLLAETLGRAIEAYRNLGKDLAIEAVVINPAAPSAGQKTLSAYVVKDGGRGKIGPDGCVTDRAAKGDPLDAISVRGGCVVIAIDRPEIRCSSDAVKLFGDVGQRTGIANPALLYVIGHELAHLYQRRVGEYGGRAEVIDLQSAPAAKLKILRDACDPVAVKRESDADAISLEVLARLLPQSPYRETVFSERGSLYWNIDQLALAADRWQRAATEREFLSQPRLHPSFVPTEFPSPAKTIAANARRFVCEVLSKNRGQVAYPGKSVTHPPLEQRIRRIAEALRPVAEGLPTTGGEQFKPIARLQEDLSPIFTHMYRETGIYLEALRARICTTVNSDRPTGDCR